MSNRPHRRRRNLTAKDTAKVARAAARAVGCTCRPDITRRHLNGETHAQVRHDVWCPATSARSQYVFVIGPDGGTR